MKFIDLFAGLGGFHVALEKLGHDCVFASEKNEILAQLYKENFGINPDRDITKVKKDLIPDHDILCAGFPCQPFSKAGSQKGFMDEKNGTLFDHILEILELKKPTYFILENVRNLKNHNDGGTWAHIKFELGELGYSIHEKILSPHNFGVPQHRERFFILGSINSLERFEWPNSSHTKQSVFNYLEDSPKSPRYLEDEKKEALQIWQEFIKAIPKSTAFPSVPIWAMEFGANYPYDDQNPVNAPIHELQKYKGSFGISFEKMTKEQILLNLPNYVTKNNNEFPGWKKRFIKKNREFYLENQKYLEPIVDKIKRLKISSWQKFEWNIKNGDRDIYKYLIQFRGSGVRIKKPDYFPSLVTVKTQVPILGWDLRYITPYEASKIQSLGNIKLPENEATSYRALGNAVNSHIVELIAKQLIIDPINDLPTEKAKKLNGNKVTQTLTV
jgi:DNA (cytosine-5)-methyltransferase 1